MNVYLIMPGEISKELTEMVKFFTKDVDTIIIKDSDNIPNLQNKKIIFAVQLNNIGWNIKLFEILTKLYERGTNALKGSSGFILIHSPLEFYTKSMAQNIIFIANQMGCRFPGHPVIECIEDLKNFRTWEKKLKIPLKNICNKLCEKFGKTFFQDNPKLIKKPKILALHASSYETSNTLTLWRMIRRHIYDCEIREFHVENGTIVDCKGCSYKTCKHYSKRNSCFYGGAVVKEILPSIERADAVVWICPNYNDAISAKIMAVINRMTVLYRKTKFYNKTMFGVIVSGNSGSDSVAKQLIGALNINKSFRLPPYFAVTAIANDPGEIIKVKGIEEKSKKFAENIMREIKA
ncbi:NAD(P)H-dependent oxidoreductase [Caminicella sporogenes]|nr:NAD(P)H-dependent oxidoreductase [Caminicella sporogenes]